MKLRKFLTITIILVFCITPILSSVQGEVGRDCSSLLPDWNGEEYHDYEATLLKLYNFNESYPDFVYMFSIGKSVQGRNIWCIRITNEKNNHNKYSCLMSGCMHGNEWEGGEVCLYFADFLLINSDNNETVKKILNTSEIYVVPLLNPDGREADIRWNDNGIDLNRNFDVHFGRLQSDNFPLGRLFGIIKIPYIYHPLKRNYSSNCGKYAFSEPETKAFRDFMRSLERYSFYLDCHTATHFFGTPGNITYKPEFSISNDKRNILNYALDWVNESTEYETIHGEEFKYTGIGCAMDWVYSEYGITSFCLEVLNIKSWLGLKPGKHDHLVHWMKTGLPVFMYLTVNIENLYHWETPDIQPPLPDGIPPPPINGSSAEDVILTPGSNLFFSP